MASRVNVTVNVRDNSRAGIRAVRRQIRSLNDDIRRAGGDARFNVTVNSARARREIQRLQRQLGGRTVTIRTTADPPDRHGFRRQMIRALTAPVRAAGRFLGGLLSDGIGQGLVAAFKSAGPVLQASMAAVLLVVIGGALAAIGGALSGLLVTALGAAFVGIAGVSAATSEEVKRNWSAAMEKIKKHFKDVGEPMIPVLHRITHRLEDMADRIAPKFKKAMEEAAPATEIFLNKILDGLESFGETAFKPIMDAWKVFAPVFGDQWDEFMRELGQSFGKMADLVREHPTEIAQALEIVFEVIELLIDTITFFGQVWASSMQMGLDATAALMEAWADFVISVVNNLGFIAEGAATALGWIPGIGGKLKAANSAFQVWRERTVSHMEGVKKKADEMRGTLDRANRRRKLEADISQWQGQMGKARRDLGKTMSAKARKKVLADISQFQARIRQAKVELAMLKDKVVNVTVRNLYDSSLNRHAKGGVVGRAATGGVRGNMTLVGEQGPELINAAPGSHVRSNADSRRLMRGITGGQSGMVQIALNIGGREMGTVLVDTLRREVAARGGNVQAAIGQKGR